ncbi:uracil-DNA glycosylase [Candidatus Dependentiae bacterium]|nr:uracil-DNA glycosylase [Candidatus Dependentiae bacterium]
MDIRLAKQQRLDALYAPYRKCTECPLGLLGRTNVVFGEGNPDATLLFTGEAPGRKEDLEGRPFIGQSGRLLDEALALAGITRSETFIGSIVKCRPPHNRPPRPIEITTCTKLFLFNQIAIIEPRIICVLGSVALNVFTEKKTAISHVRGTILPYKKGIVLFPIYHPAYLLRNRSQFNTWIDDFILLAELVSTMQK